MTLFSQSILRNLHLIVKPALFSRTILWLPVKQIPYPIKVTSSFNMSSKIIKITQTKKKTNKTATEKRRKNKSYHEEKNKKTFLLKWAMKIISSFILNLRMLKLSCDGCRFNSGVSALI